MKLSAVILLGLVTMAFAMTPPKGKAKKEGDHVKEEAHPGVDSDLHYKEGEHDKEFDHKAFLGSEDEAKEFDELPKEESQKRLLALAKRMDTDASDDVSKQELIDWISKSFRQLDQSEARKQFKRQDKDNSNTVTFPEVLQEVYGYTPEEVAQHENDKTDEMKNFIQMTKDDKKKFDLADQNKDGSLDFEEYKAYHNPHNFDHMAPIEIEKTMREYDTNKDGKVSFEEYQQKDDKDEINKDHAEEDEKEMRKQFDSYDKNKDGFLDLAEVKGWVIPAMDELANEEATHLLTEADKDKDGKLSWHEIHDNYDIFVGSQATDYGDALHKMKEEL